MDSVPDLDSGGRRFKSFQLDMENPATHGEAERIVVKVLDEHFANQEKAIIGLSLERQITDALREAGLLS